MRRRLKMTGPELKYIEEVEDGIKKVSKKYFTALKARSKKNPRGKFLHPTPKIEKAIRLAAELHKFQFRKTARTKKIFYISHPLSVAEITAKHTQREDIIIGAIMHDTIEDCDYEFNRLKQDFGDKVADIVAGVTEDIELKKKKGAKASWKERKHKYLKQLRQDSFGAMMVAAADKIHNMRSFADIYRLLGDKFLKKFNMSAKEMLWFHGEVLNILKKRLHSGIVKELAAAYFEEKELIKKLIR